MEARKLSIWMKIMILALLVVGTVVYVWAVPAFGQMLCRNYPELQYRYLPWLVGVSATALPCYGAAWYCWLLARSLGKGRSFTRENAGYLKKISRLALADTGYFLALNVVFLLLGYSHPGVLLLALLVCVVGCGIALCTAVLSHLVSQGAELQDQSDLTI